MFITPSPVFDASVSGGADNLGNLPEWDLNDLYQGTDDPKIDQDLAWLESECAAFAPITKASWRAKCRRYADLHSAQ